MAQINKVEVGKRIKSLRLKKGETQSEFGSHFDNASKGSVATWEKGVSLPNIDRLKKIAEYAGVNLSELLYGDLSNRIRNLAEAFYKARIQETQTNEFKIYYEPSRFNELCKQVYSEVTYKEKRLNTIYTDTDITSVIKKFMEQEISQDQYLPYKDENAKYYALNLIEQAKRDIEFYYSISDLEEDNIEKNYKEFKDTTNGMYYLPKLHYNKKRIKKNLDIDTYKEIMIELENCYDRIKNLKIDDN